MSERDDLLRILRRQSGLTYKQIAQEMGKSADYVRSAVARLIRGGEISPDRVSKRAMRPVGSTKPPRKPKRPHLPQKAKFASPQQYGGGNSRSGYIRLI